MSQQSKTIAKTQFKSIKFSEAIEALRRRLLVSQSSWDALVEGTALAAQIIADETASGMADDFIKSIITILEEGGTLADFRRDYHDITKQAGWKSDRGEGWHSELIFRMHVNIARNAGRWEQIQRIKKVRPYVRYVTVGDKRVRDSHALWHGTVLPVDHPFWKTHWPANGFNCRCRVQSLSKRDLARYGYKLTDLNDPLLMIPPDEGFSGNAGIASLALRDGL